MSPAVAGPQIARFGRFEADFRSCELRREGIKIRLQEQPCQILAALLEHPGQVVTREELQKRLWPADTFVDFDHGLNSAIARLREALNDSASTPKYIETVERRGYRFIASVEKPDAEIAEPVRPAAAPETSKRGVGFASTGKLALLFSFVGVLVVATVILGLNRPSRVPTLIDSLQITNDRLPKDLLSNYSRIVTDGMRLYFSETLPGGCALVQVSTQGGETARVPLDLESPTVYDISPNRSELLLGGGAFKGVSPERPLWVMPLPSGPPHRVGDILAHDAGWAPDGRHLVFVNDKDIYVAQPDGSEVRKLATVGGFAGLIRFSPDGRRLRFSVLAASTNPETWDVMEMGVDGSGLHRLFKGCCGAWSPDGKYYFYQAGERASEPYANIWVLPEQRSILNGVEPGIPARLTAGPLAFDLLTPSVDGKHLFVVGRQERIELVRYDTRSKQLAPFLGGISAGELEVSPDGQWVAYTTYPESNLWRSRLDGSERLQLTFAPMNAHEPRWSPDGKRILFTDVPLRIFIVPADGGAPRQLLPEDHPTLIGAGAWLPDGNHIVFGRAMECAVEDYPCYERAAIYLLDLKTQQVSKLAGSDGMIEARVSGDGRYVAATSIAGQKMMLYNFQTAKWSELAKGTGGVAWSRDNKFVYVVPRRVSQPDNLVRISVPDGKIERLLDLKDIALGGYWPDWISLSLDDSPLLMLDRSAQEIYRLDLQYQ